VFLPSFHARRSSDLLESESFANREEMRATSRSRIACVAIVINRECTASVAQIIASSRHDTALVQIDGSLFRGQYRSQSCEHGLRSEEHTSELQSRET